MTELNQTITQSVAEQDRKIALYCCHRGWDDAIDADTIRDGILTRFRALGKPLESVHIKRTSLVRVTVQDNAGNELIHWQRCANRPIADRANLVIELGDKEYLWVRPAYRDFFHLHELQEMGLWLLENFYH